MRTNRLIRILPWIFILYTLHITHYTSEALCASKGNPPVAYWRFDESGGGTAYDKAGSNNGTLNAGAGGTNTAVGQMWTRQGKIGGALECDGTDDYVNCGNSSAINFTSNGTFSISIWVKPNTLTSAWRRGIISQEAYLTSGYRFGFANGGTPIFWTNQSGGTLSVSGGTLAVDQWNHIEVTYDNQQAYLYLNGVQTGSATGTYVAGTNNLRLGYFVNEYFSGLIDDVRIYNYARTADQILVDYNAGTAAYLGAGTDPNEGNPPVGYWKLDENTGTTVYDRSGSGYNGTITGAAYVAGKYGLALNFNGTSNSVNIGTTVLNNRTTGTISMWINPRSAAANGGQPWLNTTIFSNDNIYLGIQILSSYKIRAYYWDTTASPKTIDSVNPVPLNSWSFITYSWDGSGSKIYINGNLETSSALTWANVNSGHVNQGNYLGSTNGASYWFDGLMDEVKIYNYARTQAQVAYDYNRGAPVAQYKFDEGGGAISHNEYSSADTGTAPVGWWRMDTASSGSANGTNNILDESGNTNHGSGNYGANLTGMSWTTGKIGNGALSFDGVDDYVTLGSNSSLRPNNITVEGWYYPTELNTTKWFHLIGLGNWNTDYSLFKNNDAGNKLWWSITTTAGNSSVSSDDNVFSLNTWCHVAATYDGSYIKMYINGILHKSAAKTGNMNYANTTVYLAKSGSGYLAGSLDDFRVYNYARTAEQIYNDYKTTHGTLVGDTKFVDGKIGKALQLDGAGDYVDCGNDASLNITDAITIEAWIFNSDYSQVTQTIVRKSSAYVLYFADVDAGEPKGLQSYFWGTSNPRLGYSYTNFVNNSWYHVAATYNGNVGKLYVNGVEVASESKTGSIATSAINVGIGAGTEGVFYFNGKIDDVRIYNYSRTVGQVMQDYNEGKSVRLGSQSAGVADPWGGALPVSHWKLDENTGVLAKDASGNGNNGTLGSGGYQPSWVNGKYGPALQFDGSDHVAIADAPAFSFTTGFTIEAWVYATSWVSPGGHNTIVGKENEFLLAVNNSGNLANYIWAGTGWTMDSNQPAMSLNRWVHMALIYDGSKIYSYLDGALQGTGTAKTGNMGDTANVLGIGKRDSASYQPFAAGKIDDVRMYNYARTQAQIAWDYNKGKPAGYWRFDEISGATCYDDSGNGNSGTATIGGTGTQTTIAASRTNGATGKYGKCMSFDGTDDYVSCGNGASLNITNTVTIEAWIKANSWATTGGVSLGVFAWKSGAYGIAFNTSGSVGGIFYRTGGTPLYIMPSSGVLNTGQWYHVAGVYDGSNAYTYVDGKLVNSASYSGTLVSNSNNLMIGGFTTDRHFNGFVDDARVYNYTRTADQILQDYNQGLAAKMGE